MKRVASFELYNYLIRVEYLPVVYDEDGDKVMGTCNMQDCILQVATHSPQDGEPLSEDVVQHNFNHEKGHAIMSFVDEKFNKNEVKIDRLGALMAQFDKTVKHEEL